MIEATSIEEEIAVVQMYKNQKEVLDKGESSGEVDAQPPLKKMKYDLMILL